MADPDYAYMGSELDVFKLARNWKRYWSSVIRPFVRGAVLEIGAGMGANAPYLMNPAVSRLVCLEPDRRFARDLEASRAALEANRMTTIEVRHGVVQDLPADERFDTILYLDVLEHTEHDREEIAAAASRLGARGHLIVLAPAFQALYSEFDRAIGHYRRYTASSLRALTGADLPVVHSRYLDAPGACLSAGNRLILHKETPSMRNIIFWDRYIIPMSRVVDPLLGRFFGRSVLCVWQKPL